MRARKPALPLDDRPTCPVCGCLYPETPCLGCPGNRATDEDIDSMVASGIEPTACDHCGSILATVHRHRTHCFDCHPKVRVERSTYCEVIGHRGQRRRFGSTVNRATVKTPVRGELRECWACDDCITRGLAKHYLDHPHTKEGAPARKEVLRAPLRLGIQESVSQPRVWVGDGPTDILSGIWKGDSWAGSQYDHTPCYLVIVHRGTRTYPVKVRRDTIPDSEALPTEVGMAVVIYGNPRVIERFGSLVDLWQAYPELQATPGKGRIV